MALFSIFLADDVLAASATGCTMILTARIITGAAFQALLGVGISLCARLTRPEVRGRAIAVARTA
jgi:predicted MFS family arabinose efflux permease